jgi:REP-associated tyrosine transposase
MARALRIERAGGWYHLTARGNERREIFYQDSDRRHFLELLQGLVEVFRVRLHAYVLMANHYHLLLEIRTTNLSQALQWLNVSYSVWFNRRHGRSGHLFQGRFKSVLVERESWGLELSRYIHLNSVRVRGLGLGKSQRGHSRAVGVEKPDPAQIRRRVQRLRRYPWSSYRAYIGAVEVPPWLTTHEVLALGGRGWQAGEKYRTYCEEAICQGAELSPWDKVIGQAVLGTERFVAQVRASLRRDEEEGRLSKQHGLEAVIAAVERVKGENWKEFRDRRGDAGRDLVLYLGRKHCGLTHRELSQKAGIAYASAATAVRRFSTRVATERQIATLAKRVMDEMNNEQS